MAEDTKEQNEGKTILIGLKASILLILRQTRVSL